VTGASEMALIRNSGSLRLTLPADESTSPASTGFTRTRRTHTVRYRRRSKRQGPSISQLVPVLLEGKAVPHRFSYKMRLIIGKLHA